MRVSDSMKYLHVEKNLQKTRSEQVNLQSQAASNKRLLKPSDDPVATARVLENRTQLNNNEQFVKNTASALDYLRYTEQGLEEISDLLIRAKELAIGQASAASANSESRRVVSKEIQHIFNQMIAIGNRRFGDRYVYGGFSTTQSPFTNTGEYVGDNGDIMIEISKGNYMAMNMPGSKVFFGHDYKSEPPRGKETLQNYPIKDYSLEPQKAEPGPELRGPASAEQQDLQLVNGQVEDFTDGINVLEVLRGLKISLQVDDTLGIQSSLEDLDQALEQVVTVRSQVGTRTASLETNLETLQKQQIDTKAIISRFEDADAFEVYSDLKKVQGNLDATLNTSGRIIQPSLLDFLR